MNSRVSPTTDRDIALLAAAATTMAAVIALAAALMAATAAATALAGGPWQMPAVGTWITGCLGLLTHPTRPAAALGAPWAPALTGRAVLFWTVTATLLAATATGGALIGTPLWRRFGPTPPGHASRADIRRELSLAAARATAEWTRPSLTAAERRRAPLGDVAAPLHRAADGTPLCTPLENPTGTLAPTQSGKSRADLVHKVLAAPGALLCSTTKPDLLEFGGLHRSRRPDAGPVLVYDATGSVAWPAKLRWSPIHGCTDPTVARRRAEALVEASALGLHTIGGNDKVFRDRAKSVMQAYLLAAATHRRDVGDLVRWAIAKPPEQEPVKLLRDAGYHDLAGNLRTEIGMVAETSDAVWMSVRRVIEPLLDPTLRELCTPRPGEEPFDARAFIHAQGSLFLVAGQHQAAQAAPLLTALVEHWLTTAQDMALDYRARRCDPVVTTVLDEITNATPVPQLPDIVSDSAGRGVLIHWGAQAMSKLEDVYTPSRTRQLLDNTTTLSVWGGIKDPRTLEWVSTLSGHHDRLRYQQHSDGLLSPGRTAVGSETTPTLRPGEVRTINRGRVLIIHRHLAPILARTVDVKKRPDWARIRADIDIVRAGAAPITTAGLATDHGEDNDPTAVTPR